MENAIKALIIAASIVIALTVITIGVLVVRQGQQTVRTSMNKVNETSTELLESEYTQYDSTIISGSELVNLIRQNKEKEIGIYVKTNKSSGKWYIKEVSGNDLKDTSNTIANILEPSHTEYINPNGEFLGTDILRDANEVIIGIKFEQKGEDSSADPGKDS